jgi:hypothetical protein
MTRQELTSKGSKDGKEFGHFDGVFVAFGGPGRFERVAVRCESEVVGAGALQMDGLERHLK